MGSSNIKSVRLWRESSFGGLQANGDPSTTVPGSAVALDAQRGEITTWGELAKNDRDTVRWRPFHVQGDAETIPDTNGDLIPRRVGDVSLVLPGLMGLGTTDPDDNPLMWILASSLFDSGTPDLAGEEATAHADDQTAGVADEAAYASGLMLQALGQQPGAQFAAVVDASASGVLRYSPAFAAELDDTAIRLCRTFGAVLGAPADVLGASLGVVADGAGFRTFATGCRLASLTVTGTGRRVDATQLNLTAALLYDDHANADGDHTPFRPAGAHVLHTLGADPILSGPIDTADDDYPRIPGRISLPIGEWTVSITPRLRPLTEWRTVIGMSDMEVYDIEVESSITLDIPNATLSRDYLDKIRRHLMLPFGPPGVGQGAALYMPGATMTGDPNVRNSQGEIIRQTLTHRPGRWGGDVGTGYLRNSPFRIGFSL